MRVDGACEDARRPSSVSNSLARLAPGLVGFDTCWRNSHGSAILWGAGLGRPATGVGIKYNRSTLRVTIVDPHKVLNGFAGRQLLLTGYTRDAAARLNVCFQAPVDIC